MNTSIIKTSGSPWYGLPLELLFGGLSDNPLLYRINPYFRYVFYLGEEATSFYSLSFFLLVLFQRRRSGKGVARLCSLIKPAHQNSLSSVSQTMTIEYGYASSDKSCAHAVCAKFALEKQQGSFIRYNKHRSLWVQIHGKSFFQCIWTLALD